MSPYITPEGERRYRDELAYLWNEERPRVTQGVADAAAEGDRSENAEYIYGKKRLRAIDKRVRFLIKRLEEVEVVPEGKRPLGRIFFGAWVRAEDEDGVLHTLRIVGSDETDMHPAYISMDSPVGRALLRREIDDDVTIRRPKGNVVWTVLEVQYDPFDDVPAAQGFVAPKVRS